MKTEIRTYNPFTNDNFKSLMIRANIQLADTCPNSIHLVLLQLSIKDGYRLLYDVVIYDSLTSTEDVISTLINKYNAKINLQDSDDCFKVIEIKDKRVEAYDWVNSLILMHKMSGG
jgi:hypothetical protein